MFRSRRGAARWAGGWLAPAARCWHSRATCSWTVCNSAGRRVIPGRPAPACRDPGRDRGRRGDPWPPLTDDFDLPAARQGRGRSGRADRGETLPAGARRHRLHRRARPASSREAGPAARRVARQRTGTDPRGGRRLRAKAPPRASPPLTSARASYRIRHAALPHTASLARRRTTRCWPSSRPGSPAPASRRRSARCRGRSGGCRTPTGSRHSSPGRRLSG